MTGDFQAQVVMLSFALGMAASIGIVWAEARHRDRKKKDK